MRTDVGEQTGGVEDAAGFDANRLRRHWQHCAEQRSPKLGPGFSVEQVLQPYRHGGVGRG
jgi:hypothetical protein